MQLPSRQIGLGIVVLVVLLFVAAVEGSAYIFVYLSSPIVLPSSTSTTSSLSEATYSMTGQFNFTFAQYAYMTTTTYGLWITETTSIHIPDRPWDDWSERVCCGTFHTYTATFYADETFPSCDSLLNSFPNVTGVTPISTITFPDGSSAEYYYMGDETGDGWIGRGPAAIYLPQIGIRGSAMNQKLATEGNLWHLINKRSNVGPPGCKGLFGCTGPGSLPGPYWRGAYPIPPEDQRGFIETPWGCPVPLGKGGMDALSFIQPLSPATSLLHVGSFVIDPVVLIFLFLGLLLIYRKRATSQAQ